MEDFDLKKFLTKYAEMDSWQYGAKALYVSSTPLFFIWKVSRGGKLREFFRLLTKLGTFGWLLFAYSNMFGELLRSLLKRNLFWASYFLSIWLHLFGDLREKVLAWEKMYKMGVYEFLGLDSYKNAVKTLKGFDDRDGLKNFTKLIKQKLAKTDNTPANGP